MEIYKILHILKRQDGGLSSSCPEPYCHCDKTQLISTEIKQCLSVKQRIKMRNTLSQELGRLRHGQDSNTGIRLWKILIIYDAFGRDVILCIKSINQLLDTAIKVMCRQDQTSCMMQSSWISFRSQLESLQVQSAKAKCVEALFSWWQEAQEDPVKQNQFKKESKSNSHSPAWAMFFWSFNQPPFLILPNALCYAWFNISNWLPLWSKFTRRFEVRHSDTFSKWLRQKQLPAFFCYVCENL